MQAQDLLQPWIGFLPARLKACCTRAGRIGFAALLRWAGGQFDNRQRA
jgi:hypothetical protein